MMDIFRFVATLFGRRYVVLIDHDKDRHVRPIVFKGGQAYAHRFPFGVATVALLNGGKTEGVSYVYGWEPYTPLAPRRWPVFEGTA